MYYLRLGFRFGLLVLLAALVYFVVFHRAVQVVEEPMAVDIPSMIQQVLVPFDFDRKELMGMSGERAGQFA